VYVEKPNTERPTYEGREIVLGPRAGDFFIVEAGLEDGERVVINGAFKIDSALQIQAKPSMMNPKGGGPPPGHDHSGETIVSGSRRQSAAVVIPSDQVAPLVEPYLALQAALAGDDLESATRSVKRMMDVVGRNGTLPDLLHTMLAADSLDEMRKPHFETLSNGLIAAIRTDATGIDGKLLVMHCPMVYEDRGADWLQADEPLRNPYFGAMMLRCGEITEELSPHRTEHDGHDH
jgi:Cu(I)/Ag(I) efflux system membrane fusion protein